MSDWIEKCSSLLAFVYRTLGSYQPNLNWKKDLDGSGNFNQSTYLQERIEQSSNHDCCHQIIF